MRRIRAFIAIEVPDEIKTHLREIQSLLRSGCAPIKDKTRFVRAANIHLTLKFLGDIDLARLGEISSGLIAATTGVKPFELRVGKIEVRSARVLWTPVEGGDSLRGLVKALEDELQLLGYERNKRPFRGHLTLARLKTTGAAKSLEKALKERDYTVNGAPFHGEGFNAL